MEIIGTKEFDILRGLNLNHKAEESIIREFVVEMDTGRWSSIEECKERFLHYGENPHKSLYMYPEIADSWVRSKKFGVNPQDQKLGYILKPRELEALILDNWAMVKITNKFMKDHLNLLSASGYFMCLTDANGVLLLTAGGKERAEKFETINGVPGAVWTEKLIGTNCHSMCINLQRPVQIIGPYYYCDVVYDNVGSGTPIMDENGKLMGVLLVIDVNTPEKQVQQTNLLSWVISAGLAIESQLRLYKQSYFLSLHNKSFERLKKEPIRAGRIILDREGKIYHIDREAAKILDIQRKDALDRPFTEASKISLPIEKVLRKKEPIYKFEAALDKSTSQQYYEIDIEPIFNGENKDPNGVFLRIVLIGSKSKEIVRTKEKEDSFDLIFGKSKALETIIQKARKVASHDGGVLIVGESGTGKELFARAIHDESRSNESFMAINCASIPKSLIESELFGYEGGSFTGAASKGRVGKIELARDGTLFLDEIGDMPLELQPVLLRVLEDKKIMRIGGDKYIPVDFRVIAATNKDLKKMVLNKEFREDLYYRLAVFKLRIPPLRVRGNDILKLAEYFIEKYCRRANINIFPQISPEVCDMFLNYDWPGNVRELENVIAYSLAMATGNNIKLNHLPEDLLCGNSLTKSKTAYEEIKIPEEYSTIEKMEIEAIRNAMEKTGNNVVAAAEILGLGRSTVYRKIKQYQIKF